MNTVTLTGRLTADPERTQAGEHAICRIRVAIPRRAQDGADFVDVVTFGRLADVCGDHLSKGRLVGIVGRLHLNQWTDGDGASRSRHEVIAATVEFLDAPKANGATPVVDEAAAPF